MTKTISRSETKRWLTLKQAAERFEVNEVTITRADLPRRVLKRDKNGKPTIVRYDVEVLDAHFLRP